MHRKIPFVLLFVFTTAAWAQQDPFVGTWKQNVAKSKYNPPPATTPRGNMHEIEAIPNGISVVTRGVNAQGQANGTRWTATYDGKDVPMNDLSGNFDTIAIKKTALRSFEAVSKKGGKALRTSQWNVSDDGTTLTRTAKTTNAQGVVNTAVLVYERQ